MQASRILCPVDFSKSSSSIVRYAQQVAQQQGAELHLLHVRELHIPYGGSLTQYEFSEDEQAQLVERMSQLVDADLTVKVEYHVIDGDAVRAHSQV